MKTLPPSFHSPARRRAEALFARQAPAARPPEVPAAAPAPDTRSETARRQAIRQGLLGFRPRLSSHPGTA